MQGIDVHTSAGGMKLYQLLSAPPNWYAVFSNGMEAESEPIAAFGLVHGPNGRSLRLVGLLGGEKDLTPVDCMFGYVRTSCMQ